ncbi:MAG: hypothetical protein AAF915_02450 [Cyanobacteria bacterium P01_D01_bin.50]
MIVIKIWVSTRQSFCTTNHIKAVLPFGKQMLLIGSSSIAADNASQRFIYNTNSGALLFDADGNQTGFDAVQIATLFNEPTISASDIFVTM